jgi:class 3 adenylate cyclase
MAQCAGRLLQECWRARRFPVCSRCHAAVPADARFCPQCGARIGDAALAPLAEAAASPPAERRQVAILFADLTGYTKLSSTLDAEEVHRILTRYFEWVDGVIGQMGGTIDKHIGDAVMAVFGAPVAHGNDTERALRAAGQIHAGMATLTREFGRPLAAHIGIASGEVVAADIGSAAHRTYTMTGDAVNLAARLVEMARAGETVISDDVYHALAHVIDADPQGTVPIRGLGRELPVWKLRALHAPGAAQGRLIGRESELLQFRELLSRVAAERTGAAVLVCADPGLGKTRLAEEFLAIAAAMGYGCHSAAVLDFGATQGRDAIHGVYCSVLGVGADAAIAERRDALNRTIAECRVDEADEPFAADLLAIPQSANSQYDAMDNEARTRGQVARTGLVERANVRQALHCY